MKRAKNSKFGTDAYKRLYFQNIISLTIHQCILYTMLRTFHTPLVCHSIIMQHFIMVTFCDLAFDLDLYLV